MSFLKWCFIFLMAVSSAAAQQTLFNGPITAPFSGTREITVAPASVPVSQYYVLSWTPSGIISSCTIALQALNGSTYTTVIAPTGCTGIGSATTTLVTSSLVSIQPVVMGTGTLYVTLSSYISLPALSSGYTTVQQAGTPLPQEPSLNFPSNTTCTDDPGNSRTNCTPSGGGGTGNVTTTPPVATNQDIVQQTGTRFSANNLSGIRYVSVAPATYNWSQVQSGTVTGSTTISFTPCPLGVVGSDTNLWVTVNAGAESDQSTGAGTCVPGANGTVVINVTGSYSNPTLSSASSGIYEGLIDAEASGNGTAHSNFRIVITPSNPPASSFYAVYAPVVIANGIADIDGSGASIDCESLDQCLWVKSVGELVIHGFRFGSKTVAPNAAITNTACASNVSTITTTLNPPVNSWVDIQGTDNPHYWGWHLVASTSSSSWTYTDTNCGGSTTIASAATPGGNAREHSAIHDDGQSLTVRDLYFDRPGWATASTFASYINVGNDQGFQADHIFAGEGVVCNANYCGQAIYAPGPFSTLSAIGFMSNLNLSMNCTGNGIKWLSGNGLTVSNSVIQGFNQYSIKSGRIRGGFGRTQLDFVYNEVGTCTNPLYIAAGFSGGCTAGAACSMAGTDIENGTVRSIGDSTGVSGGTSGGVPTFASGGSTSYQYWLVIHDGSNVSNPLNFGQATPTAGTFTIGFPRYATQTASTVTYDILKTTTVGAFAVAPAPGVAQSIALTTGLAQCSTPICTFSDTQPGLSSYTATTNPTLIAPNLSNWPGDLVLGGAAFAYVDDVVRTVVTVQNTPSVFASRCAAATPGIYVSCLAGNSSVNNNPAVGATLLQEGIDHGGDTASVLTGRQVYMYSPNGSTNNTELETWVPASPGSIIADANHRPAGNANDAYVGTDGGSKALGAEDIAIGVPIALNMYIASLPDSMSYKERLTSSLKTFAVPVLLDGVAVGSLPSAASNGGVIMYVNDSTTVSVEGQTCVGSSTHKALAFSDGTQWKCF